MKARKARKASNHDGWVCGIVTGVMLILALSFIFDLWGRIPSKQLSPGAPLAAMETARLSISELIESDGDVSGLDCYACHQEDVELHVPVDANGLAVLPEAHKDLIFSRMNCVACHSEEQGVELEWDDDGNVIMPVAHADLKLAHGRNGRNNNCFACHDRTNLRFLVARDGRKIEPADANDLCAECHGPKYRDWERGVHGRFNGYWDRHLGEARRKDCTSCHDPHAPMIPSYKPAPAPRPAHATLAQEKG